MNQRHRSIPLPYSAQSSRTTFIRKTYFHLLAAVLAFVGLQYIYFQSGVAYPMARAMTGVNWLFILGGFMLLSWFASRFASSRHSIGQQYAGLGLYVLAQSIIFVPLLVIAQVQAGGEVIETAATATLLGFLGLTGIAFGTRADFSWLGKILAVVGIGAMLLIVGGILFGFSLGLYFSIAMVVFACAAILHDTSNIIHHFPDDAYVAAAMQLFASVALLFWYVLRILMASRR